MAKNGDLWESDTMMMRMTGAIGVPNPGRDNPSPEPSPCKQDLAIIEIASKCFQFRIWYRR